MAEQGLILRCIGGLYTTRLQDGTRLECKARGLFRKDGFSPVAGDQALISYEGEAPVIAEVLPRKNSLVRPPVANIDRLILIFSAAEPAFNAGLLDKMLAIAANGGIDTAIVITKTDLQNVAGFLSLYQKAGYPCIAVDKEDPKTAEAVRALLVGGINVLCGNTGVGKTTLLNLLAGLDLETAEISKKLGRGKHTTRQIELFEQEGYFIADTPGFAALDMEQIRLDIDPAGLEQCFPEFAMHKGCRFSDCLHVGEPGCAVHEAVQSGEISSSRYASYLRLLEEVKGMSKWPKR